MSDPYGPSGQNNDPEPYGTPPANPYGAPPVNPYGAPSYGPPPGAPFGSPGYGAPNAPVKTDGISIAALVSSLLGFCTGLGFLVGIVLGIIGLSRTKQGRARGRGMAIAGIVIGALGVLIYAAIIIVLVVVGLNLIVTPGNAKAGECIDISHSVGSTSMNKASCTDAHDAQVIAVGLVTSDNLTAARKPTFCGTITPSAVRARLAAIHGLKVYSASDATAAIEVGDHIMCYVQSTTGQLTEDLLK